ncbi:symporter small accessory protein [Halobacillus hunanensis]
MLGMDGLIIVFAWVGTALSALGCVIYGLINWNKGGDDSQ